MTRHIKLYILQNIKANKLVILLQIMHPWALVLEFGMFFLTLVPPDMI